MLKVYRCDHVGLREHAVITFIGRFDNIVHWL